jgi:predicted dehydrogenase
MEKIKVGIIGMGFIGGTHIDALRRIGSVEIIAVSDVNEGLARNKAEQYGIEKCYADFDDLIADPEIQVVHDCTPNHMHFAINEQIIRAGKHIFSEKPLTKTAAESEKLLGILKEYPDRIAGVNFCYRMTSLVQDMKHKIQAGDLGKIFLVHGSYLQDWLLYDTDYNWRVEPEFAGNSRAVGDIGSHWMDLAQVLLGSRIVSVCADMVTAHPVRKKPLSEVKTFAVNTDVEYEEINIGTEDYAGVLLKFENGVTGNFLVSQISAGRKCRLDIEVDGEKGAFYWNQETSDHMWKGNRDRNNEIVYRDPNLMDPEVRDYSYMPAGHPEGWNDALRNTFNAFYKFIQDGKKLGKDTCDFATFEDGNYIMRLTEAILKSNTEKCWIDLK